MGFNTVAVLLNDFTHDLARNGEHYGPRIAEAMRNVGNKRDSLSGYFGAGVCISQAHADHTQIVVVGRNTGKPLHEANDLDWFALDQLKETLERHGYTVKPPRKARKIPAKRQAEIDSTIREWQDAYRSANGKEPPDVIYRDGWFNFATTHADGLSSTYKCRAKKMREMTANLLKRSAEESASA